MKAETILITGGAGFVGCNLAHALLEQGHAVEVLDNLSRPGSEHNLEWLRSNWSDKRLVFHQVDLRDAAGVARASSNVQRIYHLAGQTAVTTSVHHPREDFEVNALGTFNVLEGARASGNRPLLIFTSTNKVYGGMEELQVAEEETRYTLPDHPEGISEEQPLDFHSPYGCSKGAADQYVRDYSRIYDLPTVVFRMSAIYGPHQWGVEDQAWVAWFIIASVIGKPLTIYGNGKQVRDILFVEDLVRAFQMASENIEVTAGKIYNLGGGIENSISIWKEFRPLLEELLGRKLVEPALDTWRPGDQPIYISDSSKAERDFGWKAEVDVRTGVKRLVDWVLANPEHFPPAA